MFGLPEFLMDNRMKRMLKQRDDHERNRRIPLCVPWNPEMKWERQLNIQAKTYKVQHMFEVPVSSASVPRYAKPGELAVSPKERFCYYEVRLPRGMKLDTVNGRERGDVLFDGPVIVPKLHEKDSMGWRDHPWMSLTPMEMFTLRPGTRRAKGRVIIAGLGMGHQLIEVSKRKQVREIVLIEKSKELHDWLFPKIEPLLARPVDDVIIEDANIAMPKLRADVALVDIFKSYGSNAYERDDLIRACPNIKFIWAWGAASLRDTW